MLSILFSINIERIKQHIICFPTVVLLVTGVAELFLGARGEGVAFSIMALVPVETKRRPVQKAIRPFRDGCDDAALPPRMLFRDFVDVELITGRGVLHGRVHQDIADTIEAYPSFLVATLADAMSAKHGKIIDGRDLHFDNPSLGLFFERNLVRDTDLHPEGFTPVFAGKQYVRNP